MAKLDLEAQEVNARILYWGIDGAGKRTSLQGVFRKLRPDHRGEMREVPTRFDPSSTYTVLPIELGDVGGTRTRIEIVSVPGGPEHAPTRKQLLDQVDGVVWVVDTQPERLEENLASLEELAKSLADYGRSVQELPLVVQYNKCDLSEALHLEDLHRRIDLPDATVFESTATDGSGLLPALSTISKKVIRVLREQSRGQTRPPLSADGAPAPVAEPAPLAEPEPAPTPEPLAEVATAPVIELDPEDDLSADPLQSLEEAILSEDSHPEDRDEAGQETERAAWMLESEDWHHGPDLEPPLGARIGRALSIVSVGEATRADERSVRVPLVLGDEDGETSTLVLTLRLDPLVDESSG